jgi:hypothetical protein
MGRRAAVGCRVANTLPSDHPGEADRREVIGKLKANRTESKAIGG